DQQVAAAARALPGAAGGRAVGAGLGLGPVGGPALPARVPVALRGGQGALLALQRAAGLAPAALGRALLVLLRRHARRPSPVGPGRAALRRLGVVPGNDTDARLR